MKKKRGMNDHFLKCKRIYMYNFTEEQYDPNSKYILHKICISMEVDIRSYLPKFKFASFPFHGRNEPHLLHKKNVHVPSIGVPEEIHLE